MGTLRWSLLTVILASKGEVFTATYIISKARRKNIDRGSSKSAKSTSIVISSSHLHTQDPSNKVLRD